MFWRGARVLQVQLSFAVNRAWSATPLNVQLARAPKRDRCEASESGALLPPGIRSLRRRFVPGFPRRADSRMPLSEFPFARSRTQLPLASPPARRFYSDSRSRRTRSCWSGTRWHRNPLRDRPCLRRPFHAPGSAACAAQSAPNLPSAAPVLRPENLYAAIDNRPAPPRALEFLRAQYCFLAVAPSAKSPPSVRETAASANADRSLRNGLS